MPEIMELEENESYLPDQLKSFLKISPLEEEEEEEKVGDEDEEEDDDDEEEDDEDEEPVTLGFVEKTKDPQSLCRHFFPSKAGGVPAWLDPVNLPSGNSCRCGICGDPLQFLIQVYAPISEKESAFHRTLFVFMCTSMACLLQDQLGQRKNNADKPSRSVKVFRCQLPRASPFYSSEPPRHDGTSAPSLAGVALCSWCGTWKGEKVCGSCKKARYCSEQHQVMHWRSGHKTDCCQRSAPSQSFGPASGHHNSGNTSSEINHVSSTALWPEFEIVNDDECTFDMEVSEDGHATSLISKEQTDEVPQSLLDKFEGADDSKAWASFQERIAKAPEQVLRYCREVKAKPLWPRISSRPSKADIPKCSYCDGTLCFEFQILPQLLYYFGVRNDVDSLDWATITIYTCSDSCDMSSGYKEEFAWVQLSS